MIRSRPIWGQATQTLIDARVLAATAARVEPLTPAGYIPGAR